VVGGLALLVWSADRFIEGAATTARHAGMSPLLIGMVIVGLGTSAPEMVVSAFSAAQGNPGLALGNAYGSNIANIALILGITALIKPISVHSRVLKKELPILAGITLLAAYQLIDGQLSRIDAWVLLGVFALFMVWTIWQGMGDRCEDTFCVDVQSEMDAHPMSLNAAIAWLLVGIVALALSSRVLVWGAVEIARGFGISDLIIGLTVVAVGTSLPELAASIMATKKGEHDLAIGNVIGSNLFNTLAVVGIAGVIHPMDVPPEALYRDCSVMGGLTVALFFAGYGFRGRRGRINRVEAGGLVCIYLAYTGWLIYGVIRTAG
jgi:cation:H+ antiporter